VSLTLKAVPKRVKQKNVKFTINEQGVIGDVACPLVVSSLFSAGLSAVPSSWGCSGSPTVSTVEALATSTCEKYVTF
jgi:hypothetical protein